jgi:hypothetical protein
MGVFLLDVEKLNVVVILAQPSGERLESGFCHLTYIYGAIAVLASKDERVLCALGLGIGAVLCLVAQCRASGDMEISIGLGVVGVCLLVELRAVVVTIAFVLIVGLVLPSVYHFMD